MNEKLYITYLKHNKYNFGFLLTRTHLGKARARETVRELENRPSLRTEIWGTQGRSYKNYGFVGCATAWSGRQVSTIWMNILPSSSGKRSVPPKFCYLLVWSSLYQSTGCSTCLQWERRDDSTQMNGNFGWTAMQSFVLIIATKGHTPYTHATTLTQMPACRICK
jgi:hypothetical protein